MIVAKSASSSSFAWIVEHGRVCLQLQRQAGRGASRRRHRRVSCWLSRHSAIQRFCRRYSQYSSSVSPLTGKNRRSSRCNRRRCVVLRRIDIAGRPAHVSAQMLPKSRIRTAVWIVICREPAMRAPFSGCAAPYSSRVAIKPGISVSAISISVRPHSARLNVFNDSNPCGRGRSWGCFPWFQSCQSSECRYHARLISTPDPIRQERYKDFFMSLSPRSPAKLIFSDLAPSKTGHVRNRPAPSRSNRDSGRCRLAFRRR